MWIRCLLAGLVGMAAVQLHAHADPYDNWFDDADELESSWVDPSLPAHKQAFCAEQKSHSVAKRLLRKGLSPSFWNADDTLAFANPPGPINGGMCWLHSRLQRQFTYLANFRPSLPKPSRAQALRLIDRVVKRRGVTEIPGFANLREFSAAYQAELISAIDGMGWACVFNPTDCLARITDSYSPSPGEVRAVLDLLYERVIHQAGDIQFMRTRILDAAPKNLNPIDAVKSAMTAHSHLVLSMVPIQAAWFRPPTGYRLQVIDPNHPHTLETVDYSFGDTFLVIGSWKVAPYSHYEYAGDIGEMNGSIEEYCRTQAF